MKTSPARCRGSSALGDAECVRHATNRCYVGCIMGFGDGRRPHSLRRAWLAVGFATLVCLFVGVIGSSMVRAELVPYESLAADPPHVALVALNSEPASDTDESYLGDGSSALWHTFANVALHRGRLAAWLRSASPLPWQSCLIGLTGFNWRPTGANPAVAARSGVGRDLLTRFRVSRC